MATHTGRTSRVFAAGFETRGCANSETCVTGLNRHFGTIRHDDRECPTSTSKRMPRKTLRPDRIAATVEQLSKRVSERFPESGLQRVSEELVQLGEKAKTTAPLISRPIYSVRIGVGMLIGLVVVLIISLIWSGIDRIGLVGRADILNIVSALEAGTNELVLIGLGIFFLVSLETRLKRTRAIRAIHELRSIAHVIDMHQLSKDPAYFRNYPGVTKSSPTRQLTLFETIRYLDYCSELLSLTSKIAALYIQRFNDGVVLSAVSDVETLCTALSGKVWQKLQVAESILKDAAG